MRMFLKKLSAYVGVSIIMVSCQVESDNVFVAQDYVKSAVQYQKPGASVSLKNSQVNLDAAGVQYTIDLSLLSGYDHGQMSVSVSPSDGLYIVGGDLTTTGPLTKGEIRIPYTVVVGEEGRYYIYANIKIDQHGQENFRALTMIVQVGNLVSKKQSAIRSQLKGPMSTNKETIIVLPANEKIIQ